MTIFAAGDEIDHLALLKFKESISTDPYGIFLSWNSSTHFCNWHGITCNSTLQRVIELNLQGYELKGSISPHVGNLSYMRKLNLANNSFYGKIPQELGRLSQLQNLSVANNSLMGLQEINLMALFHLTCSTPSPISSNFFIGGNQMSGSISPSITNASSLLMLDFGSNHFVGQVPSVGKLQDLRYLTLWGNNLGDNSNNDFEFLKSLSNCSKLQVLDISYNNFGHHLPNSLGNLSTQLMRLYLGGNHISGEIPTTIGNLIGLTLLTMEMNNIGGIIPTTFGKFQKMQLLDLSGNRLSGEIGAFIGNLSQLFHLGMGQNMLEGNIPPSIGSLQKLEELDLSQNNLIGTIPIEVFNLSATTNYLDLSQNSISGSIPKEVGNLKNLERLSMGENHLSGEIPITIGECIVLEYLYLQKNSLQGIIPSSLASLKGLISLDLSQNCLSGLIPNVLQSISSLKYFNVSFNMLDGEVPIEGVFRNASGLAITGNSKLCGGISELHLPPCYITYKKLEKHHNHKFRLIAVMVSLISFLLILSIILIIYWMRKRSKKLSLDSPTIDQLAKVSYQSLHNGTNGFSTTNLIGSGNFSFVYKGTLGLEDKVVAIKVLNLKKKGAHKSFITECNALKNIKHRNLVQILTCCSSIDYKGHEFKALIFEYMRNGSLEQWLHPRILSAEHSRTLNLDQRLNIMIDVAFALHYLHYECEQPIIHCDLKPSNVLLDDDMIAHVSDFGIARLLSIINGTTSKQTSTSGIKGTIGYAPPEYGMGSEVSMNGDMYSFGILMLEMLTGRRPTDEIFEDGQNLHQLVEISLPNNLLQILDSSLVLELEETIIKREDTQNLTPTIEKCLVSLYKIGLACSVESPKERMNMMDVNRELSKIKKDFSPWLDKFSALKNKCVDT